MEELRLPVPDSNRSQLVAHARLLPFDERKRILLLLPELELQKHLKDLYHAMEPTYRVEVTQGPKELGKDLVLIKNDHVTTDVIGVVVKCGDIKGKTLGEVDEIIADIEDTFIFKGNRKFEEVLSQVKQATSHPAEVSFSIEKFPVNKVIVLIAGSVSSEARTRINGEIRDRVDQINGVDWLIDKFTEFYPEIFFEGRITSFIERKIEQLEHQHIAIKTNKLLSDCFVEPVVQAADVAIDLKKGIDAYLDRKKLPFLSLDSVIIGRKRVLIIGDPGTGKSAAAAKLTIDLLRQLYKSASRREHKSEKLRIPILVTAIQLEAAKSPIELLDNYFGDHDLVDETEVRLLTVDGLDEVRADTRSEVIAKAVEYAESYSAPLIVTSRAIDLLKVSPSGFEKYELLPFGAGQALSLIKKINERTDVLDVVREGLERIKHQIPMVPLSLLLLIELVEEHKEIPASVTELYDRFSDSTLGKDDKNKGIEVLFEYRIKKRFLAELAFTLFVDKGLVEIPNDTFHAFCETYGERFKFGSGELNRFVYEIERGGILCIGDETVMFRHRSFLDYFAALHLDDVRDEFSDLNGYLTDLFFRDDAGETAFFYVGLRRKIRKNLLDKIFDFPRDTIGAELAKVNVGHLLQAGWHTEAVLQKEGLARALSYLKSVRCKLIEFAKESDWRQPNLLSDLMILSTCDVSFKSGFLVTELRALLEENRGPRNSEEFFAWLALVWVLRPFLESSELNKEITAMVSELEGAALQSNEDRVEFALLISILDKRKAVFTKALKDRIKKIYSKHPTELYRLLPPKEKRRRYEPPRRR